MNTIKELQNTAAPRRPWYDDRVTTLRQEEEAFVDVTDEVDELPFDGAEEESSYDTPRKIYSYLDQCVWEQEDAKKAAALITYNCFRRGIKSNNIFVGPTGCGKTYTWRCLQSIFRDRIEIVDGSNITLDGWNGGKKWSTLLRSPIFRSGKPAILVIDEADKMLAPKYARGGENVSHSVQSEGLTIMEGTKVDVKDDSVTYEIDTSNITFVLCGAFSVKAAAIAEKQTGSRLGFSSVKEEAKPYDKPLGELDLIEFGVMPEFMGRIQRVVNLTSMTADDYYRLMDSSCGPLQRIRRQYNAEISLTEETRRLLAEKAISTGLGIRGMENQLRSMMDEALFEDCSRKRFEF